MSPSRSRRQPLPSRRNRADILKAAGVAAAIVLGTALLIWLLRPGPAGIPATGGVMNRQPRASWLILGALVAGGFVAWFVLRRGSRVRRRRARAVLTISFVVLIICTVGLGLLWPGGLLRHDVAPAEPAPTTTPTSTPTSPSTPTTKPAATGASGTTGSTGSSGPGSTAPAQTNPPR
jgi:hypothetical protein